MKVESINRTDCIVIYYKYINRSMGENLLSQTNIHDANIAVLGEGAVGKTSITVRYLKDRFDPGYIPSTKQEFVKSFKLDTG